MPKITRSNPGAVALIAERLKSLDGKTARAGWFASSKYEDGTPVAYIASIQEYGVTINHPGGTPYRIGADGKAVFVSKANGAGLPVTKPHAIVIPPRPFMRPTVAREKANWIGYMKSGARAVLKGSITANEVMEQIGLRVAADIAKSITLVLSPPLKRSTIMARLRKKSDRKTVGLLDKPLLDSGKMYEEVVNTSINHQVISK